ncbi:MAG: histidine kinase [Colwellia sp. Phe_37]|jgi:CBS domain containing-hemolysin-like protein|nr:MAG: histidine kinase [Colwellia sp. Phe_37]
MKKLNLYKTENIDDLAYPKEKRDLTVESPALEFFTDFNKVMPLVISSSTLIINLQELMVKAHVKLKFVISENEQFIGVISSSDVIPRKIVKKVSEGYKREELKVIDLMKSKNDLIALDINEVENAQIGDVIDALKESGQQHCLVLDRESHQIRGIFSASDISRKLQLSIDIQDSSSFYKVFSATS